MFKKLSNLLFDDVEVDAEVIEEPIKVAVKTEKVEKPKDAVKEVVPVEVVKQKTFTPDKEKSIFIDNNVPIVKVTPEVKEVEEEEKTYTFTPIISPILGAKNHGEKEYAVKVVASKPKKKVNHLNTIISPMFGVNKDAKQEANEIEDEGDYQDNESILEDSLVSESEQLVSEQDRTKVDEFTNLTLDDLISVDHGQEKKTHYFIGIKGTGMSALANLLDDAGYEVIGSDTENYVFTQVELIEKGIKLEKFNSQTITKDMVVVVGNSFDESHPDYAYALAVGAEVYTYPKFLGKYIQDFVSVAVSGSHGKTTTTSMIADMLRENIPTAHLIGDGRGQVDDGANIIAIEACEYKRHFIDYKADYAVITNLEWDHVDYFETDQDYLNAFEEFANQTSKVVLLFGDDLNARKLNITTPVIYYGEDASNDLYIENIVETSTHSSFDVIYNGNLVGNFTINRTGRHMIHNALATIGIGLLLGLDKDAINAGLANYQGARRRFEVTELGESVVIDDYAHHPTEILVTLEAAHTKYPDKKLVAVYHPDRIARLETFKDDFIKMLSLADVVAVGSAVDSDGMVKVIDTGVLIENIEGSFVVDDSLESVGQLAYFAPAVFVFMGTKEMHSLKMGLIEHLKRIDI